MVLPVIKHFLNLKGHQNCCIDSKVTAILLNGSILPTVTGEVATERVCACSRLVQKNVYFNQLGVRSDS